MKTRVAIALLALAVLLAAGASWAQQAPAKPQAAAPAQVQAKPDRAKILGDWTLEVDAGGMIITLTMAMTETEGKLAAKVSEQNGMFTDAEMANIEYTGEELSGEISVPSPPDGGVRAWGIKLKVGEDAVEGLISNADAGMSAAITGKRVKK